MRIVFILSACAVLLLVCVGANYVTTPPPGPAVAVTPPQQQPQQQQYLPVEGSEIRAHPNLFIGKQLQVKDIFSEMADPGAVPGEAVNYGVHTTTHLVFRTSPAGGSEMLCFLPRTDDASVTVLDSLVRRSQITVIGTLKGKAGLDLVFIVDKMYRGYGEAPVAETHTIVLTLKSLNTGKTLSYTVRELNKEFVIKLPDTLQDYGGSNAAPGTGPTDLKVIVKASVK